MPTLELTDAQVVELVRQLPPERQRAASWRWPRVLGSTARRGCSMRKGSCDALAASMASNGIRCRTSNAKISLTIFCTNVNVTASNSLWSLVIQSSHCV